MLSRRPRPTAILAGNDLCAMGALAAAHELGLSVPADLSVVGFDDIALARVVTPPLTTVRQPAQTIARLAVARLVAPSGQGGVTLVVRPRLVVRSSTARVTASSTRPISNGGGARGGLRDVPRAARARGQEAHLWPAPQAQKRPEVLRQIGRSRRRPPRARRDRPARRQGMGRTISVEVVYRGIFQTNLAKNICRGIVLAASKEGKIGIAFGRYLSGFAYTYVTYYAGLASAMIALVFLYYSAWIFIFGGELNAAIARARDVAT